MNDWVEGTTDIPTGIPVEVQFNDGSCAVITLAGSKYKPPVVANRISTGQGVKKIVMNPESAKDIVAWRLAEKGEK